jgi:hypothetical protein
MWPWEQVGNSLADGILDDETYDWLPVVKAMQPHGEAVVVDESHIRLANELAHEAGFNASYTGSAGLAGLVARRTTLQPDARVAVVVSGVRRS